ncbi:hypothetical protein H6G89_14825 [Oscillatoria sp. FACHB-1407]|uniref:hypothetical protein n=1 Tax=Oscillatoria sp. FACHB-1407 TaxID=2692847 RepID=UPI0016846BCB|nr:hypothetical protein [Oscillatoria sp. FACHB-1407]MBD2462318.1 hypothetical protein [Oscillatoria sp. FACHB-1407]
MADLTQVERELAELANQLRQSFKVLDGLAQVQGRFEELSQTHQKMKDYLEKNGSANGNTQALNDRLMQLEMGIQAGWEDLRREIAIAQNDLTLADRNINAELQTYKQEIEHRLDAFLQEWEEQREALQVPIEDFEARLRAEMKAAMNWVTQSGVNSNQVEMLDNQMRGTRTSIQVLEKQLRTMRNWLVFTVILIVMLALGLPLMLFTTRQNDANRVPVMPRTPSSRQAEPLQE